MMHKSVRTTSPQFEKQNVPRFHRLDMTHISAIKSLYNDFPFLNERIEIHMPYHRAKSVFSSNSVWVWPKFDKRPVGYLIFMDGFPPCIWYPDRQEGMTFRWILPPNFCHKGPTVCLANILSGESVLQIEDIVIYEGKNLWMNLVFSQRWNKLREFWGKLPGEQPLLAFKPRIVTPLTLEEWSQNYDPSHYWIMQPDQLNSPRWFWKDVVTIQKTIQFIPPTLKRGVEILTTLCAMCKPYTKVLLPDTYSLLSQEGEHIGIASIPNLQISLELRAQLEKYPDGFPVEVSWNEEFSKYQIQKMLPIDTPISTESFFHHKNV